MRSSLPTTQNSLAPFEHRRGRASLFALGLLSFTGCERREVDRVQLEPPIAAQSGIVGLVRDDSVEVVAFEIEEPRDLPFLEAYDRVGPLRVVARYYEEPLAELGLDAGAMPSRTTEEDFGPIPRSTSFPEDQWLDIDGEVGAQEWTRGIAGPPFSTFVSPRLPLDREGCFDLEVVGTVVSDDAPRPSRVAGLGPKLALVSYASNRSERIYVLREVAGQWTSAPIEPTHFLAQMIADRGSISFLAGDGQGGVLVGDCVRSGGTHTSTVWRSASFDAPFAPLYTEVGAPQCPAELVPQRPDEWVMRRYDGRIVRLRRVRGELVGTDLEDGRARLGMIVRDADIFGLDSGNRVHVWSADQYTGAEAIPVATDERLDRVARAGEVIVALAPKITAGLGNSFYQRGANGVWTSWVSVNAQLAHQVIPLYDSVLFTVTFGQALQLSHRDGLCPEQNDAITGVYSQTHLVALDARTFLVAGYASSSDPSAPARVAILRARPAVPQTP